MGKFNSENNFSEESEHVSTKRLTVPNMENLLGNEIKVLDHGFIRVVDYMGGDSSIVQAARVSYGKGTKKSSQDRALIRYLMRHRHSTPFEMCEIKLHIKLPIFVARQWVRHRMANINEYSARYSILDNEFYIPGTLSEQSNKNNQGRGKEISKVAGRGLLDQIENLSQMAYGVYSNLLNINDAGEPIDPEKIGIAREIARIVLPTNYYTQWYWKIDLHNLLNFIGLRADSHAQLEIREYAEKIAEITKKWVPFAFEAFEDYRVKGVQFSQQEMKIIREIIGERAATIENSDLTKRELDELMEKLTTIPSLEVH